MPSRKLVVLGLIGVAVGCSMSRTSKRSGDAAAVSFTKDIKPLLDARCSGCHTSNGLAFSLGSYDDVMPKRTAILDAVSKRRMPVWLAASGHQKYHDDPTLTDAEIKLFQAWQEGGFAKGETQAPPPPTAALLKDLDADLTLPVHAPGTAYLPTQDRPDDYRCFLVDWPMDQRKFMVGLQAVPGNKAIVHHLVVHHAAKELVPILREMDGEGGQPGYQCFGGALPDRLADPAVYAKIAKKHPGVLDGKGRGDEVWVGHYAPGMRGNLLPPGTGLPMDPGGALVIQVHYYTRNSPNTADAAGEIRFKLADSVEKPGFVMPFSNEEWIFARENRSLVVPPGKEATVSYDLPLSVIAKMGAGVLKNEQPIERLTVYSSNLHMHSFGKSAVTYLTDKAGAKDVLLDIPAWNLGYQRDYTFEAPKTFEAADLADHSLHIECTYSNKTDHEVFGGYSSDEEMCFNFAFMTPEFKAP